MISLAREEGHDFGHTDDLDAYVIGLGDVNDAVLTYTQMLRHEGYVAEGNFVKRGLKAQFKSADRKKAKYIVIIGEEEVANGTCNVKKSGEEQITIKKEELIETIGKWEGNK